MLQAVFKAEQVSARVLSFVQLRQRVCRVSVLVRIQKDAGVLLMPDSILGIITLYLLYV